MDNKIPTAEEFFEQGGTYPELAIEFAKLHVAAALKAASEKAVLKGYEYNSKIKEIKDITCEIGGNCYWQGHPEDQPYPDLQIEIDEDSILNSYPDTLIK